MAYRNKTENYLYPKDPKKRIWLTNYAGIVDADWKENVVLLSYFLILMVY